MRMRCDTHYVIWLNFLLFYQLRGSTSETTSFVHTILVFSKSLFIYYSEKEVRQVFCKLDKDGNGFISSAELKHAMMASLDEKIGSMIKEADVDGDGQINFLEFDKVNSGPSNLCCSTIVPPFKNKPEEEVLAPPKPPDGGWGWVIVFSCFMCNFIVGKNSFTVFLVTSLSPLEISMSNCFPLFSVSLFSPFPLLFPSFVHVSLGYLGSLRF